MQISVDVHNYMETLVGTVLANDEYTDKYSNEQLADLACLALNQLRPIYIRHDIDFLSRLAEKRLLVFRQQAEVAVIAAEGLIKEDRRVVREDEDVSDYSMAKSKIDNDNRELEWFEVPIVSKQ